MVLQFLPAIEKIVQAVVIVLCLILILAVGLPLVIHGDAPRQRDGWITMAVGAAGLAGGVYWLMNPIFGLGLFTSVFRLGRGEVNVEYDGETIVGADEDCCGGEEVNMDNDPVLGSDEDMFGDAHFDELYTGGGEDAILERINELVEIIDHGDNKVESLAALQGKIEDLRRDSVTNSSSVLNVLDEAISRGDQLAAGMRGLSEADRQKIDDVLGELIDLAKDTGKSSEATMERINKLKSALAPRTAGRSNE